MGIEPEKVEHLSICLSVCDQQTSTLTTYSGQLYIDPARLHGGETPPPRLLAPAGGSAVRPSLVGAALVSRSFFLNLRSVSYD